MSSPIYEVRGAEDKGTGVYAMRLIPVNETIMIGVIKEELPSNNSHAAQIGLNRYVLFEGDIAMVNHSCQPNAGIALNAMGGHNYVAMRDIAAGEEICVDYAMRNYAVEHFPSACQCGADACRGRITGWRDLPQERRDAYAGFVAPYLLDVDAS